jgi:hypothetical protein
MFNTFTRVLQSLFKSYVNERASGDMSEYLFVSLLVYMFYVLNVQQ